MEKVRKGIKTNHRFLDEAGDTSFYGSGRKANIGSPGVSNTFILGMVKFREPLEEARRKVSLLQTQVANDPYYQVKSVQKKKQGSGYYFHATDDLPEVRKLFFDLLKSMQCTFEAVVGRKTIERYENTHKGKEEYFYADLLSHLLKNKLQQNEKLILNVAERGGSTKNHNLQLALEKAKERLANSMGRKDNSQLVTRHDIAANVAFNVQYPTQEPLLNVADYFCWSVQRVFERGETRYYDYMREQISLVMDVYDTENYEEWKNYYGPKNPLTADKKISPPLH
jgi:Protein of unknown function (DUF3800)